MTSLSRGWKHSIVPKRSRERSTNNGSTLGHLRSESGDDNVLGISEGNLLKVYRLLVGMELGRPNILIYLCSLRALWKWNEMTMNDVANNCRDCKNNSSYSRNVPGWMVSRWRWWWTQCGIEIRCWAEKNNRRRSLCLSQLEIEWKTFWALLLRIVSFFGGGNSLKILRRRLFAASSPSTSSSENKWQ